MTAADRPHDTRHLKPLQASESIIGFRPGQVAADYKPLMSQYDWAQEPGTVFLCLLHGGEHFFVRQKDLELRMNWQPMISRYPNTPPLRKEKTQTPAERTRQRNGWKPIGGNKTDLERAYDLDYHFKGKKISPKDVAGFGEVSPLQLFDVSGEPAGIPPAWIINALPPPKEILGENVSPFKWYVRQCLHWKSEYELGLGMKNKVLLEPLTLNCGFQGSSEILSPGKKAYNLVSRPTCSFAIEPTIISKAERSSFPFIKTSNLNSPRWEQPLRSG